MDGWKVPSGSTWTGSTKDSPTRGRSLIARFCLVVVLVGLFVATTAGVALAEPTIQSDLPDYPPGALVTLTGSGWSAADSPVHVDVAAEGGVWTWESDVLVDEFGVFVVSFNLPDWFVSPYYVTATGASGTVAVTTFTDTSRDFKQLANEPPISWIGGALNDNKSAYREGMSVPQRLLLEGIEPVSGSHFVNFEYQFTKNGKYAYDFITSWDQAVDAAYDLDGQVWSDSWIWDGLAISSLPYYQDVEIDNDALGTPKETVYEDVLGYGPTTIRVYSDAPLTNVVVTPNTTLDGSVSGDSSYYFEVSWDGDATKVMILYASHIAVGLDTLPPTGIGWGSGMGAADAPGASYHNRLSTSSEWPGDPSDDNQIQSSGIDYQSAVAGVKFHDLDGDGQPRETGEPGLGGWEIWVDLNDNGVRDATDPWTTTLYDDPATTIDEAGMYAVYFYLPNQRPTTLDVYEQQQPPNWVQTYPASPGYHTASFEPGYLVGGKDFGNKLNNADVSVAKSDFPDPVIGGEEVTYTVLVTNNSDTVTALSVVASDTLDPNVTFIPDSVTVGGVPTSVYAFDAGTRTLTVPLGSLAPDTTTVITFKVTVTDVPPHSGYADAHDRLNLVSVTSTTPDDNLANNSDFEWTGVIPGADFPPIISITKSAEPTHVPETGGDVTYTFVIQNECEFPLTVTSLEDDKFGTLLDEAEAAWVDAGNTAPIVLAPQGEADDGFSFDYGPVSLASDSLTPHVNTVDVIATDPWDRPATAEDDATVTFTDVPPVIDVTKTADDTEVPETGQDVTFTYRITNTGPEDVTVTSIIDDKFGDLLAAAEAAWEDAGNTAPIFLPTADPDAYFEFEVTQHLASDSLTDHVNRVDVVAEDDEGTEATDYDTETVTFTDVLPEISVDKTVDPGTIPSYGGFVNYTFTITNLCSEEVTVTSIYDDKLSELPFSKDLLAIAEAAWTDAGNTGKVHLMPAGEDGDSFTFEVPNIELSGTPGEPHINEVTVRAEDNDGNYDDATDTAEVDFFVASAVTNTSYCSFDYFPDRDGDQFRLGFRADDWPNYTQNSSNPGQFYYNVFATGEPGSPVDVTITIPYPFVTNGANPIHVYDSWGFQDCSTPENPCFTQGDDVSGDFTITTAGGTDSPAGYDTIVLGDYNGFGSTTTVHVSGEIPEAGWAYVTVHLEYGLLKTGGWERGGNDQANSTEGYGSIGDDDAYETYTFGSTAAPGDEAVVESVNIFKKPVGFMGNAATQTNDPIQGLDVEIWTEDGKTLIGTDVTDEDGFYYYEYKHKGKRTNFVVKIPSRNASETGLLKANGYIINDFVF